MSTFYERKLKTSCVTCLCWKQTTPSYLAVGTTQGIVEFYWSDCTECNFASLSYQSRTSKTHYVTSLTFHPISDILIAIWCDGVMRSWNSEQGTISSQMSPHSVANNTHLNVLFNQNGTRLISTDYRGVVSMWSCDNNGTLNLLYTFKLKYACSHISLYHNNDTNETNDNELSAFYMCNDEGKIYLTTDEGHCNDILDVLQQQNDNEHEAETETETEIHFRLLQFIASHNKLIFITQDMTLYVYQLLHNNMNALSLNKSFKLSIKSNNVNVICSFLFDGLIAICNQQSVIHLFDIINNDNYILSLTDSLHCAAPNDMIDRIKFIQSTKVLIGITFKHRIVLWKYNNSSQTNESDWDILPPIALSQNISHIEAGISSQFYNPNHLGIAVFVDSKSEDNSGELKVFCETKLHYKYSNGYTFVQFAQNRLLIYLSDDKMKKIRTPFTILIIANAGNLVFVSNGEQAHLYMIDRDKTPSKVYEWDEMLCSVACIHLNAANVANIVVSYHNNIRIYSYTGSLKTTLTFQPHEGFPITMDLKLSILAVVTTENILKVWDLSGDSKSIIPHRKLDEFVRNGVQSIKLNAAANKISILSFANEDNIVDTIYIYDIEKDECATFQIDPNRSIEDHVWEENDGRFFSVCWKKMGLNNQSECVDFGDDEIKSMDIVTTRNSKASMLEMTHSEAGNASATGTAFGVISFFIAPDGIILPQEMFPTKWKLIGLHVPDFIFVSNTNTKTNIDSNKSAVIRKRIRDFIGINNIDAVTKENLQNFSYFLTVGDLDEAYRSVEDIKSSSVWENMARMCVKTRRLDVAQICISNLSSSRGTSQRIASSLFVDEGTVIKERQNDFLQLAMVAIDLKMYEDAEELLKQCDRYDLIVKMYQALGRWMSAIEICEKYDRVNLNAAYYQYATYLRESGKIETAIQFYEKCQCPLQIAQMLYQHKQMQLLQKYVLDNKNAKLFKWYAEYLESNEDYVAAMPYYKSAADYVSMVRLCCEISDISAAECIINDSASLGAAYHLASYYEDNKEIDKAIRFYRKSQTYHHALRLAKEHELDEVLIDIALKMPEKMATKIEIAARYFCEKGDLNVAVMLYKKAGNLNKAMDLCIEGQLFDELRNIMNDNLMIKDPNVALRFSQYFMQYKQYEKAVSMLIIAKKYEDALDIISTYQISLKNKELAEKLTPPKTDKNRNKILMILAKCLTQQQLYPLAARKYTQCGDKIGAVKCLIKAGDPKKIIYYAAKTKNNDALILAANYLQSLDWHSNPSYTKSILQFYSSAKAYQQLAFFYDACAQIEIDEYRDYDKALRALKQALKQTKKSNNKNEKYLLMFEERIKLVNKFSFARKLAESDPNQMISICEELIQLQNESAVRIGDVYALLVEYYHSVNDMNNAFQITQRMLNSNIILAPYLDTTMVENIYNAVGVDIKQVQLNDDDHVEEDIIDEDISPL